MPNALWDIWNEVEPKKIKDTCFTLKGYSIAALRTNFIIFEQNIMFDAGLSTGFEADHIFITHGHSDHTASIPFHTLRTNFNPDVSKKIKIFAPPTTCPNVRKYIIQLFLLSCQVETESELYGSITFDMVEATEGMHTIILNKKPYTLEVINCSHSVPCVGYGLIETRSKLKKEYHGLPSNKIKELIKEKGQSEITENINIPYFLYLGDTDATILENKEIEKYKTIAIECTFLIDDDLEQAKITQHMHWSQLQQYIKLHPEIEFILYHFSSRYKKSFITDFFEPIKMQMPNIFIWNNNSD